VSLDNDLIVQLRSMPAHGPDLQSAGVAATMTLSGVLRALFPEESADLPEDAEPAEGEDPDGNGDDEDPTEPRSDPPPEPATKPTEKLRQLYAQQIYDFLERMRDEKFYGFCTANQLVQAASFPVALAALGLKSEWVENASQAEKWVSSLVDVLFHFQPSGWETPGLLGRVRARFERDGREEVFDEIAGDGTLWAVLGVVIAWLPWHGQHGALVPALMLADLQGRSDLVAGAEVGRLGLLIDRLAVGDPRRALLEEMPREVAAIRAVERWLAAHYQEVVAEQLAAREPHLVDDTLWHPVGGWATVLEVPSGNKLVAHLRRGRRDSTIVAWGYYVNLRLAGRDHPELQEFLDALRRDS
jgi:hypothetical protein